MSVRVQHFVNRARDFFKGFDLLKDDLSNYGYSSALLGIHGAISYCDALRVGMGSDSLSSDDHRRAADELKAMLAERRFERIQGADRLEKLLQLKRRVAYASDRVDFKEIILQAERFALWAEQTGKSLRIEGWRND